MGRLYLIFLPQMASNIKLKPEGSFIMTFPLPNVPSSLHIGHALAIAIQYSLILWWVVESFCFHVFGLNILVLQELYWARRCKTSMNLGPMQVYQPIVWLRNSCKEDQRAEREERSRAQVREYYTSWSEEWWYVISLPEGRCRCPWGLSRWPVIPHCILSTRVFRLPQSLNIQNNWCIQNI